MTTTEIVEMLQSRIDRHTAKLSDEDYVEVMEELANFCEVAADAKHEELKNG